MATPAVFVIHSPAGAVFSMSTSTERKALEKLPADRFTTAQDFAGALADPGFRHGEEAAVGVAVSAGQWTPVAMALGASTLVFALVLGLLLFRPEPPQPVSRQVLSMEGLEALEAPVGFHLALAPDGSSMILPVGTSGTEGVLRPGG